MRYVPDISKTTSTTSYKMDQASQNTTTQEFNTQNSNAAGEDVPTRSPSDQRVIEQARKICVSDGIVIVETPSQSA